MQQSGLEGVDLCARVTQSSDLDHRLRAQVQACAAWEVQQIHSRGGDVLSQLARRHLEVLLVLDPLTVRWQADHLLRDPRRLALDAGFEVTEADQVGVGGLAHRVDARTPSAGSHPG